MPSPTNHRTIELVTRLQSRHTLKAWSLIITFFGDSVLPRGGRVPLAVIVAVMAELGVDATTVRAAIARLTRDGWLVRERHGRTSNYSLDAPGLSTFAEAGERIYARSLPEFFGRWTFAVTSDTAGAQRNAARKQLRAAGFGMLDNTVFVRPDSEPARPHPDNSGIHYFSTDAPSEPLPLDMLASAFKLPEIDDQYGSFSNDFERYVKEDTPEGAEAAALRTLLIHEYRRVLLRDPQLPDELAPALTHRSAARAITAELYKRWLNASETWLDTLDADWLADPKTQLSARF